MFLFKAGGDKVKLEHEMKEEEELLIDFQKAGMALNMTNVLTISILKLFEKNEVYSYEIIAPKAYYQASRLDLLGKIDSFLEKIRDLNKLQNTTETSTELQIASKYNQGVELFKNTFSDDEEAASSIDSFFEKLYTIVNQINNKNSIVKQNYLFSLILSLEKKNILIDEEDVNTIINSKVRELLLEILFSLYSQPSEYSIARDSVKHKLAVNIMNIQIADKEQNEALEKYLTKTEKVLKPTDKKRTEPGFLESSRLDEQSFELSNHYISSLDLIISQKFGNIPLKVLIDNYAATCNQASLQTHGAECKLLCDLRTNNCEIYSCAKIVVPMDGASISFDPNPLIGQTIKEIEIVRKINGKIVKVIFVVIDHHGDNSLDEKSESTTKQSHEINISVIKTAKNAYLKRSRDIMFFLKSNWATVYQCCLYYIKKRIPLSRTSLEIRNLGFDNDLPIKTLFENLRINPNLKCSYVKYKVGFKYLFDLMDLNINMPDPDTCFPAAQNMFIRSIIHGMDSIKYTPQNIENYAELLWQEIHKIMSDSTVILNRDLIICVMNTLNIQDRNINPESIINIIKSEVDIDSYLESAKLFLGRNINFDVYKENLNLILNETKKILKNLGYPKNQTSLDTRYLEPLKSTIYLACKDLTVEDNKLEAFFKISLSILKRIEIVNQSISIIDANSGTTDPVKLKDIQGKFRFPEHHQDEKGHFVLSLKIPRKQSTIRDSELINLRRLAKYWHAMLDRIHTEQGEVMSGYYKSDKKTLQTKLISSIWKLLGHGFAMVDEDGNLDFDKYNEFLKTTLNENLKLVSGKPIYRKYYRSASNTGPFVAFYNPEEQVKDGSIDPGQIRTLISLESDPAIIICCTSRINGMIGHWNYSVFTTKTHETENIKNFTEFASKVAGFVTGHEGSKLQNFFGPGGGVRGCRNVGLPFGPDIMEELIEWYHIIEVQKPTVNDNPKVFKEKNELYQQSEKEFFEWILGLQKRIVDSIIESRRKNAVSS